KAALLSAVPSSSSRRAATWYAPVASSYPPLARSTSPSSVYSMPCKPLIPSPGGRLAVTPSASRRCTRARSGRPPIRKHRPSRPRITALPQVGALLAGAGRLPVVPFGLVPLPLFVEDPGELMPGDGLHGGLAQLLKEQQRGTVAHQRLLQIPLRQCDGAEPAQVHALGAAVFQLLGNLQRRFVGLLR